MKRLGDRALLVRRPSELRGDLQCTLASIPHAVDYVLSEEHIAVYFNRVPDVSEEHILRALSAQTMPRAQKTTHTLRVRYTGPDLAAVAEQVGLTEAGIVALHCGALYEVAFLGFMPGFAYLRGLPSQLVLPRRSTPRERVAAGSVAIGGTYTGVYPFASPGGWHLLGELISPPLFDAELGPLLQAGDEIRFVPEL
ncbi:MAG: carboxyltransferase domain-containing protein [Sandaracinaceae bacterium]|nr:carboxyltransferase domain-containing protein [Sandaracinaceae bacterium]